MKSYFARLWKSSQETIQGESDPISNRSCGTRLLNSMTFTIVILCLGLWITIFLLIKDSLFTGTLSGIILTDLTCLIFFGGLVVAIFTGALVGNLFRRAFWKRLTRRKQC